MEYAGPEREKPESRAGKTTGPGERRRDATDFRPILLFYSLAI